MDDENWWEANFQMHCFILHGSCMHFTKPPYTKLLKSDKGYKETSSFLYYTGHNHAGAWGEGVMHICGDRMEKRIWESVRLRKKVKKKNIWGRGREGVRGIGVENEFVQDILTHPQGYNLFPSFYFFLHFWSSLLYILSKMKATP